MKYWYLTIALVGLALLSSCKTPKDITYFQDTTDGLVINTAETNFVKVQPGDKLRIIVSTPDEFLSEMFNLQASMRSGITSSSGTNPATILGYTVADNGTIDFPYLGEIKVEGLTRDQVASKIKNELKSRDLIKDPTVVVDFINLYVSVLGDVKNPGRFPINNDRYTLLDAIAASGDLNLTGDREKIKVIRTNDDNTQSVYEVNLLDAGGLYTSPAYYLQQNDIVYVDPNNKKKRESTTNGNTFLQYGFWISLSNLLISAAVLIKK